MSDRIQEDKTTLEGQLQAIENDPWNDEFERFRANFAAKGIILTNNQIWGGDFKDSDIRPRNKIVKKSKKAPFYQIAGQEKEPIKKSLKVSEGLTVSVSIEPEFRYLDRGISRRLIEISLTQEDITSDELAAFAKRYDKKIPKLDPRFPWDVKEKVILQQVDRTNSSPHLGENLMLIAGLKYYEEKGGIVLNNSVLEFVPSHAAELLSSADNFDIPDKPISISLGKEPAKEVFYKIIGAVERAQPVKA